MVVAALKFVDTFLNDTNHQPVAKKVFETSFSGQLLN